MKTGKFSFVAIATLAMVTSTISLDLLDVQEGSCGAIQDVATLDDVDSTFLDGLFFIPGGSKYQLYRYARGHLDFDEMQDYKFYYEACLFKNISVEEGSGSTFGFGDQQLVTYDVRPGNENDNTGVALVTSERPGQGIETGENFTSKITLTDNENFAVVVHCWEEANQKGWSLYSNHYVLDSATRRMVEEHVLGLGFDRDNVAFLEYGGCRLDDDSDDSEDVEVPSEKEGKDSKDSTKPKDKSSSQKNKNSPKSSDTTSSDKKTTGKSSSNLKEKSSFTKSKDKSSSSTKKDKSSGSGSKNKSSENDTKKSSSKSTSDHPNKSTSSSKDKSSGSKDKSNSKDKSSGSSKAKSSSDSKDKSSESSKNKSDSKKTSSHPNKSSSDSKDKSSENKNKSQSKHISSHSDKPMKDETSKIEHEEHEQHDGKKETQKSNKKTRGHSHSSTHHSSEDDSSEEKFGKESHRFQSRGYRRFGGVGGGWKR